jgi:hypothetical protein
MVAGCVVPETKRMLNEYAYLNRMSVSLALDRLVREGAERFLGEVQGAEAEGEGRAARGA